MYLLSIEGSGDGSCNFADRYKPGINIYSTEDKLWNTLKVFINDEITEYISKYTERKIIFDNIDTFRKKILSHEGIYFTENFWITFREISIEDIDISLSSYWTNKNKMYIFDHLEIIKDQIERNKEFKLEYEKYQEYKFYDV